MFCGSYFGILHEEDNTIAIGNCYTYITGTTPIGVATSGAHQEVFGGVNDGFLAQVYTQSCGLEYPTTHVTPDQTNVPVCEGCIGEASVSVGTEGCYGRPVLMSYKWSTGLEINGTTDTISSITDLCPGTYWVEITYNCDLIDTVFFDITAYGVSPITAEFTTSNVCFGDPMVFTNGSVNDPPGPITSFWTFGDSGTSTESNPEHTFPAPGTYEVTLVVTNESGCQDSVTTEVEVYPVYESELFWSICADSILNFPDGSMTAISADTMNVYNLETINGCDSLITVEVIVYPNYFHCDSIYSTFNSIVDFPDGTSQVVTTDILHRSSFVTESGCDSIILTKVFVDNPDDYIFNPPNIFTPGDDNANNTFFFPSEWVETFNCTIVNRWGVEVFQFNSIADEWDGTNTTNGKACPDGVYFYIYGGTWVSGVEFKGQGTVQLVR